MHVEVLQHTQYIIMTHIMQPMGNLRNLQWRVKLLTAIQTLQQILTWISYPTRYVNECQYILLQIVVTKQAVHSLNINIDTLVAELVASAGRNDERIIIQICTHQSIGYIEQTLSCLLTFLCKGTCFRYKTIVKSIRQNEIYRFIEQFLALVGSNITHCCETINILSSLLFYRMLALHIEFLRHLITIIGKKIIIKRLIITGNTTTDTCSMRGEHSSHLRKMLVHIEHTKSCHPFISMIDNFLAFSNNMFVETLYYQSGSIREHRCFVIVTISMKTINLIVLP